MYYPIAIVLTPTSILYIPPSYSNVAVCCFSTDVVCKGDMYYSCNNG